MSIETTATPHQIGAFAAYLVSTFPVPGVMPLSFVAELVENIPGSFGVEKLSDGTTVVTRTDGFGLPFTATRFTCEGHVPVTAFLPLDMTAGTAFLINDAPEPGVTIDDLDENDRARVRGVH